MALLLCGEELTKTWDTKNRIIKLLSVKKMTLTDLSKELDLAPSTMNQHIKELLDANAIRQIENPFYVKLKYYEVNPEFSGIERVTQRIKKPEENRVWRIVPIVIAIAVMGGLLAVFGSPLITGQSGPSVPTTFSISDAPGSAAITALNITVASAMIHSTSTGKWYTIINSSKSFNLVLLRNVSSLLATTNIPAGSYNQLVLDVSNATAVVNNQSTSVFIPSSKLRITGNFTIGGNSVNSSWINVDFNLARSLHVTGNGEVIMTPVLTIRSQDNASLGTDANGIITVRTPGGHEHNFNESMDENGNFSMGHMPLPVGADLGILTDGKVTVLGNTTNTIVIRTHGSIIVIRNVSDVANVIGNLSTEGEGHGMLPFALGCMFNGGSADCTANVTIPQGILPGPIIPCRGGMCPHNGVGSDGGGSEGGMITSDIGVGSQGSGSMGKHIGMGMNESGG